MRAAVLKRVAALLAYAMLCSSQLVTAQSPSWPPPDIKLCYINSGTVDDLGYSFTFNVARLAIHERVKALFPASTVASFMEQGDLFKSPEQRVVILAGLVRRGCHVITANNALAFHSGNYAEVSALYPNVSFIINTEPDQYLNNYSFPNMMFVMQSPRQAFYLKGAAAAAQATTCVGIIAAWEDRANPNDAINGAILGIHDENSSMPIHLVKTNSWFAPGPESDAARVMVNQLGCEVIIRYSNPRDVDLMIASEAPSGTFSVGPHSNLQRYVGDSVLVASFVSWDIGLLPMIERVLRTGQPADFTNAPFVFAGDVVKTTDLSPLASPAAVAAFARAKARVASIPDTFCSAVTLRNGTTLAASPTDCIPNSRQLYSFFTYPQVTYHGLFVHRSVCVAGEFATYVTHPNISVVCRLCPVNTFGVDGGIEECTPCENGTVALPGSTACQVLAADASAGIAVWLIVVIIVVILAIAGAAVAAAAMAGRKQTDHSNAPKVGPLCLMFTDIESSTDLWQSYPKDMAVAVETHHRVVREVIAENAGYEVKTVGDCFMIACTSMVDGAMIAVQIQQALHEAQWPDSLKYLAGEMAPFHGLKVRIGVHWCEDVEPKYEAGRDYWDYYGNDVNISARVESKARGGQVLLSHAALEALRQDDMYAMMLEPLVEVSVFARGVELKGVAETVTLYTLLPTELSGRTFEPLEGHAEDLLKSGGDLAHNSDASSVASERFTAVLTHSTVFSVLQKMLSKCPVTERGKIAKTLASTWDPASKDKPVAHALRGVANAMAQPNAGVAHPLSPNVSGSTTASGW